MKIQTSLVILLLGIILIDALPYSKESGVINLDTSNFANSVFSSEHIWIVEFYAPWCGHCKNLAPEYEKLAKNMKGIAKVAAVNCDEEKNKDLAGAFGIQGFPTIKVFGSDIKKTSQGYVKDPIDYTGARSASAMADFLVNQLPNFVTNVNEKNIDTFTATDTAKVLLFTNKKEVANLFKALAVDFHYGIEFGVVKDTDKALVAKYNVDKFPTLVVLPKGKPEEPAKYTGDVKHEPITKFLLAYAPERPQAEEFVREEVKREPVRPVREEIVNQDEFEKVCFNKAASCIITLLDPLTSGPEEHEKQLHILEELQQNNEGKFLFVWIDGSQQYKFADKMNMLSGFPNVILFNHKKMATVNYIGGFNSVSLQEFLDGVLRGDKSVRPSLIKTIPPLETARPVRDEL